MLFDPTERNVNPLLFQTGIRTVKELVLTLAIHDLIPAVNYNCIGEELATILKSPFYSSSCCQTCFPSIVRPMNRLWEFVLMIFLLFSRNEPLHLLLDALVVNDKEDRLLSSIPHNRRENISLIQYRSSSFFQWERFLVKSQQVLFFVVLLWPLIGMQNHSHLISTHILRTALLRFPARCWSDSSQTCLIHEKF